MDIEVKQIDPPKKFKPVQVVITLNSLEEQRTLYHLFGCYHNPEGCELTKEVLDLINQIKNVLYKHGMRA